MPTQRENPHPPVVLLVEDTEMDAFLVKSCFADSHWDVDLHHVVDGEHCLDFLRRKTPHEKAPRPDLIILDLNMPRMCGRETLRAIVADENLRTLPVVVLTTSVAPQDLTDMYGLRCSTYIRKPLDYVAFERVMKEIHDYWLTIASLPPKV